MASESRIRELLQGYISPLIAARGNTTGKVVFVDSGATGAGTTSVTLADSSIGAKPVGSVYSTLASAMDNVAATNGDIIYIMPGHAESTRAVAIDVAGITIIGLGKGRARPAFTFSGAAADLFDVSVANVHIENIRLIGGTNATALIDVAAADFTLKGCSIEHGAAPTIAITVASGARGTVEDCLFLGTAAGCDTAIDFEAATGSTDCLDWTIKNNKFNYSGSSGLDVGCIKTVNAVTGWEVSNNVFIGMDTLALDFNSSSGAAAVDGIVFGNRMSATTALTSIEDIIDPGGFGYIDNLAVDAPDVRGANVPLTSAQ